MNSLVVNWNFDPVLVMIGSVDIRWYGLMWALAIFTGSLFFDNFCRREGLREEVSYSIFWYGTLATMIGARLGHCLFYAPQVYLPRPWEIITGIRDGGLASHGAALGLLIGLWLFSRKNRLPYVWSLDRIMIPVGIGGALVRLGNLFNSEIVGRVTDVPWGFRFVRNFRHLPLEEIPPQHPAQIYEALCYLATFGVLCLLYYRYDMGRRRPGLLFGVGLIGVFFTRIFIEMVKEEQEAFERGMLLDMGQLLSIPFVVLGVWMIVRSLRRPAAEARKEPEPQKVHNVKKVKK